MYTPVQWTMVGKGQWLTMDNGRKWTMIDNEEWTKVEIYLFIQSHKFFSIYTSISSRKSNS